MSTLAYEDAINFNFFCGRLGWGWGVGGLTSIERILPIPVSLPYYSKYSIWNTYYLEYLLFGILVIWNACYLECLVFGMLSIWNTLILY